VITLGSTGCLHSTGCAEPAARRSVPRAQIKDEKTYRELRKQGESKEKSARIANASAGQGRRKVAARGGRSGAYQDWPKADLLQRAREIGIKGRSSMTKAQLISALRNH
jgi:hypothetical protein